MGVLRFTLETHFQVFILRCYQKGLTEGERPLLNVGCAIPWGRGPDWMEWRKWVWDQHLSLLPTSSWAHYESLPWWTPPSDGAKINPSFLLCLQVVIATFSIKVPQIRVISCWEGQPKSCPDGLYWCWRPTLSMGVTFYKQPRHKGGWGQCCSTFSLAAELIRTWLWLLPLLLTALLTSEQAFPGFHCGLRTIALQETSGLTTPDWDCWGTQPPG